MSLLRHFDYLSLNVIWWTVGLISGCSFLIDPTPNSLEVDLGLPSLGQLEDQFLNQNHDQDTLHLIDQDINLSLIHI